MNSVARAVPYAGQHRDAQSSRAFPDSTPVNPALAGGTGVLHE
jgi:hypothetical protein